MITYGTGGAISPQAQADAAVIFAAETWAPQETPRQIVEPASMPFKHLVINGDRMQE
jgi:hypothetical protein